MKLDELEWIIRDFDGSNMDECRHFAEYLMPFIGHHIPKWRPIEEAPRDGTRFLAFEKSSEGSRYECWWQQDLTGWSGWQNDWDNEPNPTHWKPLDPEPSDLQQ